MCKGLLMNASLCLDGLLMNGSLCLEVLLRWPLERALSADSSKTSGLGSNANCAKRNLKTKRLNELVSGKFKPANFFMPLMSKYH